MVAGEEAAGGEVGVSRLLILREVEESGCEDDEENEAETRREEEEASLWKAVTLRL